MEKARNDSHDFHNPDVKVLYVEDEAFSREKLLHILERRFRNVLVAIDGDEGYDLYLQNHPDLVIADIKMNSMNGLEMIEKIRRQDDEVQIIVTSAYEDSEYLLQSIENNINYFILKPIDLEKFLFAIRKSVDHILLEKMLEKQKKITSAIADFQDGLIFFIQNERIVEFNDSFRAFSGINEKAAMNATHLAGLFVEDSNYFYPKDFQNWMEEFFTERNSIAKVRWIGINGREGIYLMKSSYIPSDNQYLFICTNITELEIQCRKNEFIASLDPLTNCINRLHFLDRLEMEISQAESRKSIFSIILFDIDHFKDVNTQFGLRTGDEVLVTLSTIIQQRIGEKDILGRWEGDEFILIIPDESNKNAALLAESIRSLIEGFHFQNADFITCSFGVAEFSTGKSAQHLLEEAENALYESKITGNNRVTVFSKKNALQEGVQNG